MQQLCDQLYGTSLTREQTAERLGVTTDQVDELVTAGHLVTVDGLDGPRLPD